MPLGVGGTILQAAAARRRSSREIVDAARPSRRAISRTPRPCTLQSDISSRSANDRYRPDSAVDDAVSVDGRMPPTSRNQRDPTGCDTPTPIAASSLDKPAAINVQKRRRSSRPAAPGRPGERNLSRRALSERCFPAIFATSIQVLRRPLESVQYAAEPYRRALEQHGIKQSMSRRGNCLDNAPMEAFFASLKKEQIHHARFRTREEAKAAVFEYVEIFYNRQRLHSALGYRTPVETRLRMEGVAMRAAA